MSNPSASAGLPGAIVHLAVIALCGLLLASAGQPIFSDDSWWHLALGRAYAAAGPWLAEDPLLFTAVGPPVPAAWLFDLAMFESLSLGGFTALRVLHVFCVVAILALVWSLLRRACREPVVASLGVAAFVLLAAYRLVQLRPELVTIAATLALFRVLVEVGGPPSWRRVGVALGILWLWSNAHAGFLLAPFLLAAAIAGIVLAAWLRPPDDRSEAMARARRLSAALGLGIAVTWIHPAGAEAYAAFFVAGADTPALAIVVDEWARFAPFAWPVPRRPPAPIAWLLCWGLLLAVPVLAMRAIRGRGADGGRGLDPALGAMAAASLVALLVAVRFAWLGVFGLLLVASALPRADGRRWPLTRLRAWVAAGVAVAAIPAFAWLGAWPMISRGADIRQPAYARPYPTAKYAAHAIWMLSDAGLTGNVYADYSNGGFLGYWLAPELRVLVNGTLNVPVEVMQARGSIAARRGLAPDETFAELLDRQGVDVFFGSGLPRASIPTRPSRSSTRHLEGVPGWVLSYRNASSAVYVRANERNRANLDRVAAYYADRGVPFDRERGVEPDRILREAPDYAIRQALLPWSYGEIATAMGSHDLILQKVARNLLAEIFAVIGLYERAVELDRRSIVYAPTDTRITRRLAWSSMRLGLRDAALEYAEKLAAAPSQDRAAHALANSVRSWADLADPEEAAAFAAKLPLLTRDEARTFGASLMPAEIRPPRG